MATLEIVEAQTNEGPVKLNDRTSNPIQISDEILVGSGDTDPGQQKENQQPPADTDARKETQPKIAPHSSDPESYFPAPPNLLSVPVHYSPARSLSLLSPTSKGTASGGLSPKSDISCVKTPTEYYGPRQQQNIGHGDTIQASSYNVPNQWDTHRASSTDDTTQASPSNVPTRQDIQGSSSLDDVAQASLSNVPDQVDNQGTSSPEVTERSSSSVVPNQLEDERSDSMGGTTQASSPDVPNQQGKKFGSPREIFQDQGNLIADQNQSPSQLGTLEVTLKQIQSEARFNKLWYKIHVLVYDLQKVQKHEDNRDSVNRVTNLAVASHLSPLGAPYFDSQEIETLKSLQVSVQPWNCFTLGRKKMPLWAVFGREKRPLWVLLKLRYDLNCLQLANQGGRYSCPLINFGSEALFSGNTEDLGRFLQCVLGVKKKNIRKETFLRMMSQNGLDVQCCQKWL